MLAVIDRWLLTSVDFRGFKIVNIEEMIEWLSLLIFKLIL